jgi:hypothetical protein
MLLDEIGEAELDELVLRLDNLVPKEGAHLTIPADPDGNATVGNRLGYLRFGVEMLRAALRPVPGSDEAPPRILPNLDYLLTTGSEAPFDLCEIDESIVSRPPVASKLGAVGQLAAGVLVVGAIILLLIGALVVWRSVFG